jgi:hypothetical protein
MWESLDFTRNQALIGLPCISHNMLLPYCYKNILKLYTIHNNGPRWLVSDSMGYPPNPMLRPRVIG